MISRPGHGALLLVALASILALSTIACNEQSNDLPFGASTAAPLQSASGPVAPVGPFPRGTVDPALAPDPALEGPEIAVLEPSGPGQTEAASATVRVRAQDPDGVTGVEIGGVPAQPLGGDEYAASVPLAPGLNLIDVRASDGRGNDRTALVSVVQGRLQADDQRLASSLGLALSPTGLDRLAGLLETGLNPLDLQSLVAGPVYRSSLLEADVTGVRNGPAGLTLAGSPQGLTITLVLPALEVDLDVRLLGLSSLRGTLHADPATAVIEAVFSRTPPPGRPVSQALGLYLDRIDLTLNAFRLDTPGSGLGSALAPHQATLRGVVEDLLEKVLLDEVGALLHGALAGVDVPIGIPVPLANGTTADLQVQLELDQGRGDGLGGLLLAGGPRLSLPPGAGRPGATSLIRVTGAQVALPALSGPEAFGLLASEDLVNGVLHTLWKADGMRLTIDGKQPTATTSAFTWAGMLHPFLPPLRALVPDPNTPLILELELDAAPLLTFDPGAARPVRALVPDVLLSVWVDYMDGGPPLELFQVRGALVAGADVALVGDQIRLADLQLESARVDVLREPTLDLDDQAVEDFVRGIAPWLANEFKLSTRHLPIPTLPLGLRVTNGRTHVQPGVLLLNGDL